MHLPHTAEPDTPRGSPRARPVRRAGATLAGLVLVATVPLVADALDAEEIVGESATTLARPTSPPTPDEAAPGVVTPPVPRSAATPTPVPPPVEATPSDDLPDDAPALSDDTPNPRDPAPRDPAPTDPAPGPSTPTTPAGPASATDTDTEPAADVPTDVPTADAPTATVDATNPLTAAYAWDERSPRVVELQRLLGVTADGWYGAATHRAHLAALAEAGLPTDVAPERPGPEEMAWAALRQCESGGDYSIVSRSGRYRGAYQFDRTTWDSVAGRHAPGLVGVDPAAAAPADQDAMARALYGERGAQPWPHCGRHLP